MFCNKCGNQLPDGAQFCASCGNRLTPAEEAPVVAPAEETPAAEPVETAQSFEAPEVQEPAVEAPAKKNLKKRILIIGIAVIALVAIIFATIFTIQIVSYNKALDCLDSGDYEKAQQCLERAGDYSDAKDTLKDLKTFRKALAKLEEHEFEEAENYFKKVKRFLNSKEYIESIIPYEQGLYLLEQKDFDGASSVFNELEDYRDSAEYVENIIPYEMALYMMECADNNEPKGYEALYGYTPETLGTYEKKELYNAAATKFDELGEYKDAKQKKNDCYYKAGLLYIEEENWYTVDSYIEMMDEDQKQTLIDAYKEACADDDFLAALKQALTKRSELVASGGTREQIVAAEVALLEEFPSKHFYDEELSSLCYNYVYGLTSYEQYSLNSSNPDYWWLQGGMKRHEALDALNEKYDFLNDDEALKKEFIGTKYLLEIEYALYNEFNYTYWHYESKDRYYLDFTNETQYTFTLNVTVKYYDGESVVHSSTVTPVKVTPNQSEKLYFKPIASGTDYTKWVVEYSFELADAE